MNTLRWFYGIGFALLLIGCEPQSSSKSGADSTIEQVQQETALEHAKKHADPNYVCPMHPQIVRDEPGSCPICGMALVEREPVAQTPAERKILFYRNPMNPEITSPVPAQDEMGMDYIPVYSEPGGDAAAVRIDPVVVQNLGVRTETVARGNLWRRVDSVGYVGFDERRISHVHLRTEGWIEQLNVHSVGERVKAGDKLFEIYAPSLANAQEEFIQALRAGQAGLVKASRERLNALGIDNAQIRHIEKTREPLQRIAVRAHHAGTVAQLNVRDGMYVTPSTEVLTLADLSSVWLLADVFERQADWVKVGQSAEVRLPYRPGEVREGQVEFIYPNLDPKTRTLRVRLRFDNEDEALKPDMYAQVQIFAGPIRDVLSVPREALIRTGRSTRVILAEEEGKFRAVEVESGIESGDWVEVREGLAEGDRVVISGQFLIDSEASIRASMLRMQGEGAK